MSASNTPSIFDFLPDTGGTAAPAAQPGRLVSMRAQYIVDLSLDLHQVRVEAQRDDLVTRMGVHVSTASHAADMHEVRLSLKLEVFIAERPVVTIELAYGGLVWTEGTYTAPALDAALHIEAAALLYPMARHILLENLAHTGYATSIPSPNFHELYDRHLAGGGGTH